MARASVAQPRATVKPLTAGERYALLAVYGETWPRMNTRALLAAIEAIRPSTRMVAR